MFNARRRPVACRRRPSAANDLPCAQWPQPAYFSHRSMRSSVDLSCASPPISNTSCGCVREEAKRADYSPRRMLEIEAHALVRECHRLLFGSQIDFSRSRDQGLRIAEEARQIELSGQATANFTRQGNRISRSAQCGRKVEGRFCRNPAKAAHQHASRARDTVNYFPAVATPME